MKLKINGLKDQTFHKMVFLKIARARYLKNLALFTSGIGDSAREVNNLELSEK